MRLAMQFSASLSYAGKQFGEVYISGGGSPTLTCGQIVSYNANSGTAVPREHTQLDCNMTAYFTEFSTILTTFAAKSRVSGVVGSSADI